MHVSFEALEYSEMGQTNLSNLRHVIGLVVELLDNAIESRRDLIESAPTHLHAFAFVHTSTDALSD